MDLFLPLLAVVLVIAGAYYTTRWIAKKQNAFSSGKIIKVIERIMLSKDVFLAIVQVDTKIFLMSVSAGKTELLTELPETVLAGYRQSSSNVDFLGLFKSLINKKENSDVGGGDKKDE